MAVPWNDILAVVDDGLIRDLNYQQRRLWTHFCKAVEDKQPAVCSVCTKKHYFSCCLLALVTYLAECCWICRPAVVVGRVRSLKFQLDPCSLSDWRNSTDARSFVAFCYDGMRWTRVCDERLLMAFTCACDGFSSCALTKHACALSLAQRIVVVRMQVGSRLSGGALWWIYGHGGAPCSEINAYCIECSNIQ